jgi:acetyl-CoA acetyltransferase
MDGLQRGAAAIVGVAESDLGAVAKEVSAIDLMAQGIHRALGDCGLALRDVDGLLCATAQSRTSGLALAEYLGISPAFVDTTILGGSSFMFHVAHAQAALQLGLCKVAVIAYGSTQRTIGRRQASVREYNPYETPFRPFLPSTAYALAASRHMHQFGTTREQLAAVAVAAREWALLNPAAWEKRPLSTAEVLSARMVSYPFTVRDCCLITDGGGAVIMTTAERARSLKKPPIYVLGCGQAITHANISSMADLTVTGALQSIRWPGSPQKTSISWSSTTPSRSTRSSSSRISAFARRARAAPLWPTGISPPAAACRLTPTAAGSPIATPACTGCSC